MQELSYFFQVSSPYNPDLDDQIKSLANIIDKKMSNQPQSISFVLGKHWN